MKSESLKRSRKGSYIPRVKPLQLISMESSTNHSPSLLMSALPMQQSTEQDVMSFLNTEFECKPREQRGSLYAVHRLIPVSMSASDVKDTRQTFSAVLEDTVSSVTTGALLLQDALQAFDKSLEGKTLCMPERSLGPISYALAAPLLFSNDSIRTDTDPSPLSLATNLMDLVVLQVAHCLLHNGRYERLTRRQLALRRRLGTLPTEDLALMEMISTQFIQEQRGNGLKGALSRLFKRALRIRRFARRAPVAFWDWVLGFAQLETPGSNRSEHDESLEQLYSFLSDQCLAFDVYTDQLPLFHPTPTADSNWFFELTSSRVCFDVEEVELLQSQLILSSRVTQAIHACVTERLLRVLSALGPLFRTTQQLFKASSSHRVNNHSKHAKDLANHSLGLTLLRTLRYRDHHQRLLIWPMSELKHFSVLSALESRAGLVLVHPTRLLSPLSVRSVSYKRDDGRLYDVPGTNPLLSKGLTKGLFGSLEDLTWQQMKELWTKLLACLETNDESHLLTLNTVENDQLLARLYAKEVSDEDSSSDDDDDAGTLWPVTIGTCDIIQLYEKPSVDESSNISYGLQRHCYLLSTSLLSCMEAMVICLLLVRRAWHLSSKKAPGELLETLRSCLLTEELISPVDSLQQWRSTLKRRCDITRQWLEQETSLRHIPTEERESLRDLPDCVGFLLWKLHRQLSLDQGKDSSLSYAVFIRRCFANGLCDLEVILL